ncbi:protein SPMIP2 isoform X2 [Rhineura floridana]|uniref:protein SPMIP2 isoform X2 n=1 Tax=Rhineura floridana TaxID=261503 RepID=UPI002AC82818|nr:protein SPMIP2 isoform X2 [Rhineura floridana]
MDAGKDRRLPLAAGPDGLRNYIPRLPECTLYIGTTTAPVEGTSEAAYLWRPAQSHPLPPQWYPRCCIPGEIGWGVREFGSFSQRGKQIMPERFPPAEEFEIVNRYRNPGLNKHPAPDPRHLGWADYPNYHPVMVTLDRSETSPRRTKDKL